MSDITNKTTVVRFAQWEVRSEILIKSTVSVSLLSAIKELGALSYQGKFKITFISIAERIVVNVVFCISKESVSCEQTCWALFCLRSPICFVDIGFRNGGR